jgi:hypothetical protein
MRGFGRCRKPQRSGGFSASAARPCSARSLSPDSAWAFPGQALSLLAMPKHTSHEECPEDEDRLKHETQPIIPCAKFESLHAAALDRDIDIGHHQEDQQDRKPDAGPLPKIW